ncbi:MAG: DUF5803 family protein [Methanolinea sp.]|nr:DUF5803 family protein [Methanolinea sp.]
MQSTSGDRRGSSLVTLCIAVLLVILPCAASRADYHILPNGTAYSASLDLADATGYEFFEAGILGERVPVKVVDVALTGNCSPCTFSWRGENTILFPKGNYTLTFQGPVRDNHFIAIYDRPHRVTIVLPAGFDVRNPALGMVSSGATVTDLPEGLTDISWNTTRIAEIRFYEKGREDLLYLFANIWIVIAIVMLVPFVLTWRKDHISP